MTKTALYVVAGLALIATLTNYAFAAKTTPIKVEIVSPTEDTPYRYRNGGLLGAIEGTKTAVVVFAVNAIINGDHARLKCAEGHHSCSALGPGVYDGELHGDSVWISFPKPITHKLIRDHYKVAGSW